MAAAERLYEQDVVAWTQDQAAALRRLADERWNGPLDLLNLAEEIEDVGREIVLGVLSQVERVILHLLKLQHAAAPGPRRQWLLSVRNARHHVQRRTSAGVRRRIEQELDRLYAHAYGDARLQLLDHDEREAITHLPVDNPYTLDQILDEAWYPASRHGHADEV